MILSSLTLLRPDDWHLHLRDGEVMQAVLADTARVFARAVVMPNLKPPVRTVAEAAAYRARIAAAFSGDMTLAGGIPGGHTGRQFAGGPRGGKKAAVEVPPPAEQSAQRVPFQPLMTLYLTEDTSPEEVARAKESGFIHAFKLYPAGATTHSDAGVRDWPRIHPTLRTMAELGMPLLLHGEVVDPEVDIFDREALFITRTLEPLLMQLPTLRVVLEHITTREAAHFVWRAPENVAATITAHHLLLNRNAMLVGGMQPHHYCLPVLKREMHRQALLEAVASGSPRFFLGTDSAPHARSTKEHACGCAGIYTARDAIALYAEAFAEAHALDRLEGFASRHGPLFYRLPANRDTITLVPQPREIPATLPYLPDDPLVPFRAGGSTRWSLLENRKCDP